MFLLSLSALLVEKDLRFERRSWVTEPGAAVNLLTCSLASFSLAILTQRWANCHPTFFSKQLQSILLSFKFRSYDQKKEGGEEEAKYTISCLFNDPQRQRLFIPFYWQDSRRPRPQNWQFAEGELKRMLHYSCAIVSPHHIPTLRKVKLDEDFPFLCVL